MKMVPLGEVATIERSGVEPSALPPETRYLGLEHIERGGRITGYDTVVNAALASTKFKFSSEHVLYGKLRPNLCKVCRPDFAGVCSTDILPIRPGEHLDRNYLAHFLSQPSMVDFAASRASGANLPRLSPAVLATFRIPLPPLDEQRRIAAILDHADTLRAKQRQASTNIDELTQSLFLEMFGDSSARFTTISDIAKPEKGSIRTGPFGSQLLHSEFVDDGIAVLGLDNVVGNEFIWGERRFITPTKFEALRRYIVHPGDVLVSIMGTCGRCAVVPKSIGTAINTKHICAITVDTDVALPEYVRAAFLWHPTSRKYLSKMTKGSIMDGLNMGIIKAMPLPLAAISAQREFVERSQRIETFKSVATRVGNEIDELFASLQSRAFSGTL